MKIAYKFDEPSVYVNGIHYFPNDIQGNKIEGVFYDHKWRQSTFKEDQVFLHKLQTFYRKNLPHPPATKIKTGHYQNKFGEVKKVENPIKGWIIKPKGKEYFYEHNVFDTKKMAEEAMYSLITGQAV